MQEFPSYLCADVLRLHGRLRIFCVCRDQKDGEVGPVPVHAVGREKLGNYILDSHGGVMYN